MSDPRQPQRDRRVADFRSFRICIPTFPGSLSRLPIGTTDVRRSCSVLVGMTLVARMNVTREEELEVVDPGDIADNYWRLRVICTVRIRRTSASMSHQQSPRLRRSCTGWGDASPGSRSSSNCSCSASTSSARASHASRDAKCLRHHLGLLIVPHRPTDTFRPVGQRHRVRSLGCVLIWTY